MAARLSAWSVERSLRGRGRSKRERGRQPNVLFLGCAYAGNRTRFDNLRLHTHDDPRMLARYRMVTGWRPGGWIERARFAPPGLRGRLRSAIEAAPFATLPRPDLIWTSALEVAAPYAWAQLGTLRRPLLYDLDATSAQLEAIAPIYFNRAPRRGLRRAIARAMELVVWRGTSLFTPWSNWAADGLRRDGIPSERIRVLPPGVDLDLWQPAPRRGSADSARPLRLLFVGADFSRKGGPALLDVFRRRLRGRAELDLVTASEVQAEPGVRVHHAVPNSPLLRELYRRADLFVLPTRAECFGIATVEAMASGLPVVVSNLGGAPDIVDHAVTGWLIEPGARSLAAALEAALDRREQLRAMGGRAREAAQERFDGRRNDRRIVDVLLEQWQAFQSERGAQETPDARSAHERTP